MSTKEVIEKTSAIKILLTAFFTLKMSFQKFWAKVTKLLKETIQMNEDLGVKLRPKSLVNSNSNHEAYAHCEKT